MAEANKKIIARNTLALYFRMLLVMGVSLFTSRIVLEKLGVTEFGVYSSVAGVVAMLGFLNATLSTSTGRFLTFELGRGNFEKLRHTFATAFYTHLGLALTMVVVLVGGGTWFVLNQLVIPADLKTPALLAFYISVFTAFIAFTQVPYTAVILAHERMSIYAYVGILEALAKLGVAYLIALAPIQKLVWYALLIAAIHLMSAMSFRFYCIRNYKESHISGKFDRGLCKQMLGFSGWTLIANLTDLLLNQGIVVLINMLFQPALAAAQAIANQVYNAVSQFANNFTLAINPQIIKLYAAGDRAASRRLNLETTGYVWALMLLFGLPLIVCMNPIMHIWLVEVPPYAVVFAQYMMVRMIISTFSITFYTPMWASGKLMVNSLACLLIGILGYALMYVLLRIGFDIMWVQYIGVLQAVLFSFVVKPLILCRQINYTFREMLGCFGSCFKIALLPVAVTLLLPRLLNPSDGFGALVAVMVIVMVSVVGSTLLCIPRDQRANLLAMVKSKLSGRAAK